MTPLPPLQASLEGSEALLSLPGAVMIGREPLDLGPWPDVGPLRATRAVLASAYSIVQVVKVWGREGGRYRRCLSRCWVPKFSCRPKLTCPPHFNHHPTVRSLWMLSVGTPSSSSVASSSSCTTSRAPRRPLRPPLPEPQRSGSSPSSSRGSSWVVAAAAGAQSSSTEEEEEEEGAPPFVHMAAAAAVVCW